MTKQAWLALYDRLAVIEKEGDVLELFGLLRLLLIELRPEEKK